MTPIRALADAGTISRAQQRAANLFREEHKSAVRWLERGRLGDPGHAHRYKQAVIALRELRAPVVNVVVHNRTPEEWVEAEGFTPAGTLAMLRAGLDVLARHYGMVPTREDRTRAHTPA